MSLVGLSGTCCEQSSTKQESCAHFLW